MTIYEPIREPDGTFSLSKEDLAELKKEYNSDQIFAALLKIYEFNKPQQTEQSTVVSGDIQPCSDCGGIDFIRTGNCHACTTCGASQGCS